MTQKIEFTNEIGVELISSMGTDLTIVNAARVSFNKHSDTMTDRDKGLIAFLMREYHLSPLEHCSITFRVSAPIFVAREHMRHRTQAFSEMSARYVELAPLFYLPGPERPLIQVGKPGAYSFEAGSISDYLTVKTCLTQAYEEAWTQYQLMLDAGVAKEVARMALPVSTYSSWYVSANLRNWLAFLSLRTTEQALYEIRQLAFQVEEHLNELYPITMAAWGDSGRGNL